MNLKEMLSASSVESRSEKEESDEEEETQPKSGSYVLKKLNLRKDSFKGSEMSMDVGQEMSDDCEDYPKP